MTQTTKINCPHGFNGTQEQLLNALRYHPKSESRSSYCVKEAAASEIERLKEYEWMYKDLCK